MSQDLFVCGGCNAKIGAKDLDKILQAIPIHKRNDVLVGFEKKDDAAVIQIGDELAITTVDFFPPMVTDPYLFGRIAATNALSDIYAMGGEVISAMNLVCFPEEEDPKILSEILRGGAEVVAEAGATLCGGHSIHDPRIKYGLSVFGKATKETLWRNDTAREGDALLLTKPLGVSLLMTGYTVGEVSEEDYQKALAFMGTSNKEAAEILRDFSPHAVTDVTGFGLLGHLVEMCDHRLTATLFMEKIPVMDGAKKAAEEFVLTAGGQRNRKALEEKVLLEGLSFAEEEILFDPQTSGGLLVALSQDRLPHALSALKDAGISACHIGNFGPSLAIDVLVKHERTH